MWLAFDQISPGYPERGDLQAARICEVISGVHTTKRSRLRPLTDFLLRFGPKKVVRQTAQVIKMKLLAFKASFEEARKE